MRFISENTYGLKYLLIGYFAKMPIAHGFKPWAMGKMPAKSTNHYPTLFRLSTSILRIERKNTHLWCYFPSLFEEWRGSASEAKPGRGLYFTCDNFATTCILLYSMYKYNPLKINLVCENNAN
jgi:hypothetical protein